MTIDRVSSSREANLEIYNNSYYPHFVLYAYLHLYAQWHKLVFSIVNVLFYAEF